MLPDNAADVLIHEFSKHGCTAYLGGPNTLIIRFPGGGKGSLDITEWRISVSRIPYPALLGHAVPWGQAVMNKQMTKRAQAQAPAPAPASLPPAAPAPWAAGAAPVQPMPAAPLQPMPAAPLQPMPAAPSQHGEPQSPVGRMIAEGRLRVRLYPEDAFAHPPGMREAMIVRPLAEGLVQAVVEDLPDSIRPVNRVDLGGVPEHEAFGAGLRAALDKEESYTDRNEIRGFPIINVGGRHRYVGAHVQVLGRHARPGRVGALVAFPLPEYILVHEIGEKVIFEAMDIMEELGRKLQNNAEKPISSQLYWWRPGRYEQLPEQQALSSGQVPDLRPVGVDLQRDGADVSVQPRNDTTMELIDVWTRELQAGGR